MSFVAGAGAIVGIWFSQSCVNQCLGTVWCGDWHPLLVSKDMAVVRRFVHLEGCLPTATTAPGSDAAKCWRKVIYAARSSHEMDAIKELKDDCARRATRRRLNEKLLKTMKFVKDYGRLL